MFVVHRVADEKHSGGHTGFPTLRRLNRTAELKTDCPVLMAGLRANPVASDTATRASSGSKKICEANHSVIQKHRCALVKG